MRVSTALFVEVRQHGRHTTEQHAEKYADSHQHSDDTEPLLIDTHSSNITIPLPKHPTILMYIAKTNINLN